MLTPILGAAAVSAALPLLWWALSNERAPQGVARNLAGGMQTDLRRAILERSATDRAIAPAMQALASRARRLTPGGMLDALERRILFAGGRWALERVLALKLVLGMGAAALGLLWFFAAPGTVVLVLALGLAALGWFGPDLYLSNESEKRQGLITRALPDVLDQLTISVEAGLGFEAAMGRVGRSGRGPIADEFVRTLQDIQAGMARADALTRLADRSSVPELRHFVLAVIQAESFGLPTARVLRVQAAELRVKRRQLAEERAMKLPVKVMFPLVLCILPAMFIVILGPAVVRISEDLFTSI